MFKFNPNYISNTVAQDLSNVLGLRHISDDEFYSRSHRCNLEPGTYGYTYKFDLGVSCKGLSDHASDKLFKQLKVLDVYKDKFKEIETKYPGVVCGPSYYALYDNLYIAVGFPRSLTWEEC